MRTRWRVFFLVLLAACGLAVPQSLLAQSPTPPANDDCLACHGDSSAVSADGRPVAVAPDAFAGSVHGALGLSCVSCHADLATLTEYPHPDKLKPADCSSCHEAPVTQFMASAHAAGPGGHRPPAAVQRGALGGLALAPRRRLRDGRRAAPVLRSRDADDLRPEKFPIDTVIFTGSVPEHELREERPGEYERLTREGRLETLVVPAPTAATVRYGRIVGGLALATGVVLFLLILRAAFF